jgi:hypothetical protein
LSLSYCVLHPHSTSVRARFLSSGRFSFSQLLSARFSPRDKHWVWGATSWFNKFIIEALNCTSPYISTTLENARSSS